MTDQPGNSILSTSQTNLTKIHVEVIFALPDEQVAIDVELPGEAIEMKDIGLPHGVAYAGLAETVILALEGRFEDFTKGSNTQWEKVKEIYKLGIKHGMALSSISGVDGPLTQEDISRVKAQALKQRG